MSTTPTTKRAAVSMEFLRLAQHCIAAWLYLPEQPLPSRRSLYFKALALVQYDRARDVLNGKPDRTGATQ